MNSNLAKKLFTTKESNTKLKLTGTNNSYVSQSINSIYNESYANQPSYEPTVSADKTNCIEKDNQLSKQRQIQSNENSCKLQQQSVATIPETSTEMSADLILEQTTQQAKLKAKSVVKTKTFFGGEEIKSIEQIQHQFQHPLPSTLPSISYLPHLNVNNKDNNISNNNSSTSSLDYFNFEFVGAGIKLEKSILIVNSQSSNPNITFGENSK